MLNDITYPSRGRRAFPAQYRKVLFHPSVQSFEEVKEQATWSSVWLQLIVLSILSAALSVCALLIIPSQVPTMQGVSQQTVQLITYISTGIVIFIATPISFFISGALLRLLGKIFGGDGTYLQQMYTLMLFGVPLVLLSSLLQLIPDTKAWLPYIPHLYSIFLLLCSMKAIHHLTRNRFIGITITICVLALLGLLIIVWFIIL